MYTVVYDATHANIGTLPDSATYAGYVTGTPDIVWTPEDKRKHPDFLEIDQTPVNGPWSALADGDDFERGAVAASELPVRAKLRMQAFKNAARPGQRMPFVYASANSISTVANALVNGGVTSGVGLWVAHWTGNIVDAINEVKARSGPFPVIGVQFVNEGPFDVSVFATAYLNNRSGRLSPRTMIGVVTYIQQGFQATPNDIVAKHVVSTDDASTWK